MEDLEDLGVGDAFEALVAEDSVDGFAVGVGSVLDKSIGRFRLRGDPELTSISAILWDDGDAAGGGAG